MTATEYFKQMLLEALETVAGLRAQLDVAHADIAALKAELASKSGRELRRAQRRESERSE